MPTAIPVVDSDSDIVNISPPTTAEDLPALKAPVRSAGQAITPMSDMKPSEQEKVKAEELQTRIDEAVRRVREKSDQLQAVAQPYAQKTREFAESRPVLFTFMVIFIALSAVPVFFFATFLLASTLFILGFAAIGICISTLCTILIATSILLPVLLFTLITSTCILSFLLFLFLAHRLYVHITLATSDGGETKADVEHLAMGVKNWAEETKDRVALSTLGYRGKVRWAEADGKDGKWVVEDVVVKKEDDGDVTLVSQGEEGKVRGLRLRATG